MSSDRNTCLQKADEAKQRAAQAPRNTTAWAEIALIESAMRC
jgi:hypothetical protein